MLSVLLAGLRRRVFSPAISITLVAAAVAQLPVQAGGGGGGGPLNVRTASATYLVAPSAAAAVVLNDSNSAATLTQFSGVIGWGDGSQSIGVFAKTGCGSFTMTGAHTYGSVGTYNIAFVIHDSGGNAAFASATLRPRPAWISAGNLIDPRFGQTVTALQDGSVVAAGGSNGFGPLSSAERFRPACGEWIATGSLSAPRVNHVSAMLQNGKVLVAGGDAGSVPCCQPALATAELYDPASGAWARAGSLHVAREFSTATPLPSGKVLVAGGGAQVSSMTDDFTTAELYDPATGTWSDTGHISGDRRNPTATLLTNGTVLLAGGEGNGPMGGIVLASAEIYDPASGLWRATGTMKVAREAHKASLLPNGKVLIEGGQTDASGPLAGATTTAELYDPTTGTWTLTGSMSTPRVVHTATLVNGKVLAAGGIDQNNNALASSELYDPHTGTWTAGPDMSSVRSFGGAVSFAGGVLNVGGVNGQGFQTAELYEQ